MGDVSSLQSNGAGIKDPGGNGGTQSVRLHRLVLAAALLVPALLFAAAWQSHREVMRAGQDAIARTAAVMQEQARSVLLAGELVMDEVDDRLDGESWDGIEAPSVAAFLRRLKAATGSIRSIWVTDETGLIRVGAGPFVPGQRIPGGGFFKSVRETDDGLVISQLYRDATGQPAFSMIRRRTVPDGSFAGTIHASIDPATFTRFYAETAPPFPHVAMLVRGDGTVLAREPAGGPEKLADNGPTLRRIADGGTGSRIGVDQDSGGSIVEQAVRRVGDDPVFVVFAVRERDLLAPWFHNLTVYGAGAACAALVLLIVSSTAIRHAQAEQAALAQLRTENRQRLAAEEHLRHGQRMDAVGRLTGGVAHDFSNLLTAIHGHLELIARAAAEAPERDMGAREQIGRLALAGIKGVERGAALTRSLLAFARRQPMQPRAMDPNKEVGEFLPLLRQACGNAITVVFEPGLDLPSCRADPVELETALLNLATNARDAMPDGGALTIETAAAVLGAAELGGNTEAQPGLFVSIRVADSGTGMTGEVAARAVEPFFTTKPLGQGTGLGLSQVFGMVRQLGGHLEIITEFRRGTTVTLFLPSDPPPAA